MTGATGFVGASLVRLLVSSGVGVRAIVRSGSDRSSLTGLDLDLREGDLSDVRAIETALAGCDACFHAAAAISGDAATLHRTNVEGTRTVLEAAFRAGCTAIVHTSTMGTLSREDDGPARETDHRLAPGSSDYVKSKFEAEGVARSLAHQGAPIVIVHPSAPVGPWDRVPTLSGRRVLQVLEGKLPRWIAGAINHVHVRDVAQGMILAAMKGRPGESYLLAHQHGNLTRDQFVQLVSEAAQIPPPRTKRRLGFLAWLRRGPSAALTVSKGPTSLACDPGWTLAQLGLPQTSLQEAFREAIDWFRSRPRQNP